jgi:hypothetical protein
LGCSKKIQSENVSPESWGHGYILEDVWIDNKKGYEDWEPHVQAFKNEDGSLALRFCYWKRVNGQRANFVNTAMFVYDYTMEDLRDEAKKGEADIILMLFRKLAE